MCAPSYVAESGEPTRLSAREWTFAFIRSHRRPHLYSYLSFPEVVSNGVSERYLRLKVRWVDDIVQAISLARSNQPVLWGESVLTVHTSIVVPPLEYLEVAVQSKTPYPQGEGDKCLLDRPCPICGHVSCRLHPNLCYLRTSA